MAGLAPTMAMALGTSFAATEAGDAVPLCYVFAMIGSFALAYVIVRFARRRPGSGVAFTYVDQAFGKTAGFVADSFMPRVALRDCGHPGYKRCRHKRHFG